MKKAAVRFDYERALEFGFSTLARPPARPWIERPKVKGDLVASFALPVALCPTGNDQRRKPDWWYAKMREGQFRAMLPGFLASGLKRGEPLPGRPQVLAVKFSPKPPDALADFAKGAIDRLICPLHEWRHSTVRGVTVRRYVDLRRFGLILDDSPEDAEVKQWWEPAAKADECVIVMVRKGESNAVAEG